MEKNNFIDTEKQIQKIVKTLETLRNEQISQDEQSEIFKQTIENKKKAQSSSVLKKISKLFNKPKEIPQEEIRGIENTIQIKLPFFSLEEMTQTLNCLQKENIMKQVKNMKDKDFLILTEQPIIVIYINNNRLNIMTFREPLHNDVYTSSGHIYKTPEKILKKTIKVQDALQKQENIEKIKKNIKDYSKYFILNEFKEKKNEHEIQFKGIALWNSKSVEENEQNIKKIPYETRKKYVYQLKEAIERLHSIDLIHGDIKCANTVIHEDRLKLIDFDGIINDNEPLSFFSTTHYPFKSKKKIGSKITDIYAFMITCSQFFPEIDFLPNVEEFQKSNNLSLEEILIYIQNQNTFDNEKISTYQAIMSKINNPIQHKTTNTQPNVMAQKKMEDKKNTTKTVNKNEEDITQIVHGDKGMRETKIGGKKNVIKINYYEQGSQYPKNFDTKKIQPCISKNNIKK